MTQNQKLQDLELIEWGLIRVTTGSVTTLHAVGIRMNHPHEKSRIAVTSPIRSISDDRRILETQNSLYALDREIDQFALDHCAHHVWLLALRSIRSDRIDWLRTDGTIYRSMEQPELAEVTEREAAARRVR